MLVNKLLALSLSAWLISCGGENVADDYLKKGGSATAADAKPANGAGSGDVKTGTESEGGMEDDTGSDMDTGSADMGGTGDAAKGAKLMESCAACHTPNGLAKTVTLNASAVARLDEAYKGKQAAFHAPFAESFEAPNRADLEAALKAIP